jgi:hypothetical protein
MTTKAKKATTTSAQEVCIDLPGEAVQCWRSSDNIRVRLRKHRDVFFDINLKDGATYTVESASDFYSPRDKKLLRKVEFRDGDRFHVWVGREFKGSLVLKTNGRAMGNYVVNRLDTKSYDADPKTKPEPLMVIMGQRDLPASFTCTANDPFGIGSSQRLFKTSFDPKLSMLKEFGTKFDYSYSPEAPEVKEYVAVTEAMPHEVQTQVMKQLDSGVAVEGSVDQIFVAPKHDQQPSLLYTALATAVGYISGTELLTANSFKETVGYLQENFRSLNKLGMTVRIEKRVKGKYMVALKGRTVTNLIGQALGVTNAKTVHKKLPVGSKGSTFIDGGFSRSGKAGYGGVRRIMLTASENFRGGMKIQMIGTVIDIVVDANAVYFDEKGSQDLSEFLRRAGVSIAKAGATAVIGSVLAAFVTAFFVAAGAPLAVTVGLVVVGYILAATIVDLIDSSFQLKERAAHAAR